MAPLPASSSVRKDKEMEYFDYEKIGDLNIILILKTMSYFYGSQKALAKILGVSEQYLSDVIRHRRYPGKKILEPLGLSETKTYYVVDGAKYRNWIDLDKGKEDV